jgi:hypothetical protein
MSCGCERGSGMTGPRVESCCFSCCREETFVQDQLCCKFDVPASAAAVTQTVYETNVSPCKLVVSGNIMLCSAPFASQTVTVTFLRGTTPVETATITPGICFTFTKSNFTAIQLTFPSSGATTVPTTTPHWIGDVCVTPRYPVGN